MNIINLSKTLAVFTAVTILYTSCASTTVIKSEPSGAKLYLNGEPVESTPYTHHDTKIISTVTYVTLEKDGYETLETSFSRDEEVDVGAVIGGRFILFPFLWAMKYKPTHTYELKNSEINNTNTANSISSENNSTTELIKLKNLLDDGSITSEDFTTVKVKILNNQYNYENSIADEIKQLKSLLDANLLTSDEYTIQKDKIINEK